MRGLVSGARWVFRHLFLAWVLLAVLFGLLAIARLVIGVEWLAEVGACISLSMAALASWRDKA